MQREVKCEVLARKKPSNFDPGYSEGFVLHAPADLPDGNYTVKFDGHIMNTTKERRMWHTSTSIRSCP